MQPFLQLGHSSNIGFLRHGNVECLPSNLRSSRKEREKKEKQNTWLNLQTMQTMEISAKFSGKLPLVVLMCIGYCPVELSRNLHRLHRLQVQARVEDEATTAQNGLNSTKLSGKLRQMVLVCIGFCPLESSTDLHRLHRRQAQARVEGISYTATTRALHSNRCFHDSSVCPGGRGVELLTGNSNSCV